MKADAIAVSDTAGNPAQIEDIPVYGIEKFCADKKRMTVFLVVAGRNVIPVMEKLRELGFDDIRFVCLKSSDDLL